MTGAVQLFCLPHAGGSALSFHRAAAGVPGPLRLVPLDLPRRGPRPAAGGLAEAAARLADTVRDRLTGPRYAVLGHSMGALVAYELTRALEAAGAGPALLVASGRNAPHRPTPWARRALALPDAELLVQLGGLGGVPPVGGSFATAHFLPRLRADLALAAGYRAAPGGHRIAAPIQVFAGRDDPLTDLPSLRGWARHTRGRCWVERAEGRHFFLYEQLGRLAGRVYDRLLNDEG